MAEEWRKIEEGARVGHDMSKAPKTGDWRYMKPKIKKTDCIGCAQCFSFCPEACIDFDENRKAEINYDICKGCGVCSTVCPKSAIIMEKNS